MTKAYAEAERRGLLAGHVGRGSFVAEALGAPGDGVLEHRAINVTHILLP